MEEKIFKLNSVPFLWVSGLFLLASFVFEYVCPFFSVEIAVAVNPAWVSLVISGIPLAYLAVISILERKITSPILITIAMIAAVCIGDIFAAGEIAFIMAIGEFLEDKTVEKAKKGIEMLLNLVPAQGRVIGLDGETMVDAKNIPEKAIIRVLPGESFPADGVIVVGNTTVDQSIMTGESLPVDKTVGDEVFTGTINRFGAVDVEVSKSFANSSLQKMIQLVEAADNQKAPTQRIVDKWAGYLVPAACVIAVVTYGAFAFVLGRTDDALTRAVTILVVFCPCALALATPTSIMAAIGQATRNGVLIKSGEALEQMGTVTTVCFDKTGTITQGKLTVSDIFPMGMEEDSLMALVSAVERRSEHPIGKAIVDYTRAYPQCPVSDFLLTVGQGVQADIDGQTIFCGNERLITNGANCAIDDTVTTTISALREQGKAVIIVANTQGVLGVVGLSDTIKDTSKMAIAALKAAGIEKPVLLTGDNEKSAMFMGDKVGISDIYPSLLPEGKVSVIQDLMEQGKSVCMVGDGVNDAPALKTASVGIAMGTMGSDIAIDAADIAIMGDDLSKIAYIKKLSNATIFSIKFNITLSMVINFCAIILSVMGVLTPASGALVHNAGSVLVVLNAARLYDKKIV
ncbi:cation-translocating P-type ATPase [Bengtsoniella intestinalis]|uniref:heavy metal translocating P-type ATPase n=1 Tax=Bengtsoniella intestinalis TaxID=3073143 RepID=UPI00391F6686